VLTCGTCHPCRRRNTRAPHTAAVTANLKHLASQIHWGFGQVGYSALNRKETISNTSKTYRKTVFNQKDNLYRPTLLWLTWTRPCPEVVHKLYLGISDLLLVDIFKRTVLLYRTQISISRKPL